MARKAQPIFGHALNWGGCKTLYVLRTLYQLNSDAMIAGVDSVERNYISVYFWESTTENIFAIV